MDNDFSSFHALKESGGSPLQDCLEAGSKGDDFFFQIRMLREVFELDLAQARDIAANFDKDA